jgi:hypothetical protein
MHFPVGWDLLLRDYMTLADVYHYATRTTDTTDARSPFPTQTGRTRDPERRRGRA